MKKWLFIILFIIIGCSQAQTYYTDFGGTYLYTWRLGNIDSNATIWWNHTSKKLQLIRPIWGDTVDFMFGSSAGGWTKSGTTPAKIYSDAGIKVHVRSVAGDTTGTALFNSYGTAYFSDLTTFNDSALVNGTFLFGASGEFVLPTYDPYPNAGRLYRSTDLLKYTNSSGDRKTVATTDIAGGGTNTNWFTTGKFIKYNGTKLISTTYDSTSFLPSSLTSAYIFVGNGSNVATGVAVSGDATINNAGAVAVVDDSHNHTSTTVSSATNASNVVTATDETTNVNAYVTFTPVADGNANMLVSTDMLFNPSTARLTVTNLTSTNTITGSISGNAGTVTNGVYTSGSYSNPAWITGLDVGKITGTFSAGQFLHYSGGTIASSGYSPGDFVPTTRTLNTLALSSNQTFATGTSGTDFAISSSGTTHTFNIPDASATNRGLITTGAQTLAGVKTYNGGISFGAVGTFTAPILSSGNGGSVWYYVGVMKYRDAVAGADKTIATTTDLSSYVPTSRTITINSTSYDLSANRSWTVGDALVASANNFTAANNRFRRALYLGDDTQTEEGYLIFDNASNSYTTTLQSSTTSSSKTLTLPDVTGTLAVVTMGSESYWATVGGIKFYTRTITINGTGYTVITSAQEP